MLSPLGRVGETTLCRNLSLLPAVCRVARFYIRFFITFSFLYKKETIQLCSSVVESSTEQANGILATLGKGEAMKITAKLVRQVQKLWAAEKWSQRKIARKLGLCRKSVRRIVDVQRGLQVHRPDDEPPIDAPPAERPQRCPGCGGKVYLPCRLCAARRITQRRLKQPPIAPKRHAA